MSGGAFRRLNRVAPGLAALLGYQRAHLGNDLIAGLSVAAVALPVGIAYSDIARVPAVVGIYSAIFPLFAYAVFGSSRQLMTGPDAATCIIAAASLGAIAGGDPQRYMTLMVAMTLMTGVLCIVAGAGRFGFIANFLSQPILVGYLNGIALILLVGQIPKLLGLPSEASDFFPKVAELAGHLDATHLPTLVLGTALLALFLALRQVAPRLPAALIVVVAGIVAVAALELQDRGIAVLGAVPGGLPEMVLPVIGFGEIRHLVSDAAGLTLIGFTSGVLTAKSFARRNRYDIDANQELIAFGACNIASGLAQGFPVTGTASRTAVNDATGGRTQLVGIVGGAAMLVFLLFLTAPLAFLPNAALAALIIVPAWSLFDFAALRTLSIASRRELLLCLATTGGVLVLGVLPGVVLAVVLSLVWLLSVGSRPSDAVLGRIKGVEGFHEIADHPEAEPIPGLLIYRFNAGLVAFNCGYFKQRLLKAIAEARTPVEWVVLDASPINVVDFTALQEAIELRDELAARGIVLAVARTKGVLAHFFRREWLRETEKRYGESLFPTLRSAVHAFELRHQAEGPEAGAERK